MGAHREAAAQYERALRHATDLSPDERASLLAGWFPAAYATGRVRECAKVAEELAELARERGDLLDEANWRKWEAQALVSDGRNPEADAAMDRAIQLLERLPPSPVHARVFQSQSSMRMLNRDYDQALHWGERAVALARRFDLPDVHAGALNAMGSARLIGIDTEQGRAELEEGLTIARRAGIDRAVASILGNLGSGHGEIYRFGHAERYLIEGVAFTRERDLDGWHWYQVAWLALTRMFQGRWTEAAGLAASALRTRAADTIALIMAQIALGRVRARRGDPEAWDALDAALALANPTGTLQRVAPARAARAEAAWLDGRPDRAATEACAVYDLAVQYKHPWHIGELGYWRWKAGDLEEPPDGAADPYARQIRGDWAGAAEAWTALGCPYESARALAESDDEEPLRRALETFDRLGARPMATLVAKRLRELGVRSIPRGPRPATRANPANLTAREVEILALISDGLRNAEIAGRLFLSPKTVEHHVSAILAKLGATSRSDAVREAIRLGLVTQTGGDHTPS
jgi:DNA-binding CsgD family transcriptional regulator/tetratricopeptide (TPR) repeat protein